MLIKNLVEKNDPENQFEVLVNSYKQIETAWNTEIDPSKVDKSKISNIIVSGLGGSAIAGDMLRNYLRSELKYPYQVNRNYNLPSFVNENSLVIISSYSGNTEETISALQDALKMNAQIICLTTGGKIGEIALENNLTVVNLKEGFQPRYALYSSFFVLLKVFQELKLVENQNSFVLDILELVRNKGTEYLNEGNYAFQLAEELVGFTPVIYGVADFTDALAARFKGQLNENSKVHAFHNVLPEMNHNEIVGWETYSEMSNNFKVVQLHDKDYHTQVKKRISVLSELISKMDCKIINLESKLADHKMRLFELVYLTDWISYYIALQREKDPSEIDNIHYLKKVLAK